MIDFDCQLGRLWNQLRDTPSEWVCEGIFKRGQSCSRVGGPDILLLLLQLFSSFTRSFFQDGLMTSDCPGILQALSTRLGMLRHLASCSCWFLVSPACRQPLFHWPNNCINHSSKSPFNIQSIGSVPYALAVLKHEWAACIWRLNLSILAFMG